MGTDPGPSAPPPSAEPGVAAPTKQAGAAADTDAADLHDVFRSLYEGDEWALSDDESDDDAQAAHTAPAETEPEPEAVVTTRFTRVSLYTFYKADTPGAVPPRARRPHPPLQHAAQAAHLPRPQTAPDRHRIDERAPPAPSSVELCAILTAAAAGAPADVQARDICGPPARQYRRGSGSTARVDELRRRRARVRVWRTVGRRRAQCYC